MTANDPNIPYIYSLIYSGAREFSSSCKVHCPLFSLDGINMAVSYRSAVDAITPFLNFQWLLNTHIHDQDADSMFIRKGGIRIHLENVRSDEKELLTVNYTVLLFHVTPVIVGLKFRESCREAFKKLQLLTLPCLYILETTLFCMSTCALTRGRDIHMFETQRWFMNACTRRSTDPNSIKDAPTPKALKTRLKRFLVSQAFYNADEFSAFDWETAQLED
ncbi:hypothetical protein J6590_033448 [Homalodisca vitripennis]|nr:hypothetical protein J6590_033448 [Homalodisca vitripennis]